MDHVNIIACTLPDWPVLVSTCTRMFGKSPTRVMDQQKVIVGSPASYCMLLEHINNNDSAINNLKEAELSLDFIHVTLAIQFEDYDLAPYFCNRISCPIQRYNNKIIFCATLRQVRDFVNRDNEQLSNIISLIRLNMCSLGFKTLFSLSK